MTLFEELHTWMTSAFAGCHVEFTSDGGFVDLFGSAGAMRITVGRWYFDAEVIDVHSAAQLHWQHTEATSLRATHQDLITHLATTYLDSAP